MHYRSSTRYAGATLDVLAAAGLAVVLFFEHRHAVRSSALVGLYLAVSIIVDAIAARSYFIRDHSPLAAISVASAACRLALIIVNEKSKADLIIDPVVQEASGREATSGFWSRSFFFFLGPIFRLGLKGTIRSQDLPPIGIEFSSKRLFNALSRNWRPDPSPGRYSLLLACFHTWKRPLGAILLPRLLLTGFNFSQPYLLQAVINSANADRNEDEDPALAGEKSLKPYLVLATLVVFSGSGLTKSISTHMKYRLIIRLRGGLMTMTMEKSHRLKVSDARRDVPISLLNAEIGGIADMLPECVEVPFNFFESGLGVYLLWLFIQRSGFIIILPIAVATVSSIIFGHFSAPAMRVWNDHIESRVSKTSQIISQLPAIKILGLGPVTSEYIQSLRRREMEMSKKYRTIRAGATAAASFCDLVTPTTVVAAALFWGGFGGQFTPEVVYPMLALVVHVQEPLAALFTSIPNAKTMVGYFYRIQEYLCQAEHRDPRIAMQESRGQHQPDVAPLIGFRDATIAPSASELAVLRNINLEILPGTTTAVFGPTSSGKTTFLESMLGEADILGGQLHANGNAVGYCGQTVYLPNTTVEKCIIGQCKYNESWFNTVVTACQLTEDLRALPGGKDYVVGPGGIALSGGQKVRVSLARAAFAMARLVILDDSLSSLDGPTAQSLLTALCGEDGLFTHNGTALVISCNMVLCVDYADQYIVLDGKGNVSRSTPQDDPDIRSRLEWLFNQESSATCSNAQRQPHSEQASLPSASEPGNQDHENRLRQQGGLSLYLFWLKFAGGTAFAVWLSLITLAGIADGSPKIALRLWVATGAYHEQYFVAYSVIPLGVAIVCFISLLLIFRILGPRAAVGLHGELTKTVFKASLGAFGAANTDSIVNMYSLDMTLVGKMIPAHTHNTVYFTSSALMQVGIAVAGAVYLLAAIPFLCLILFYLQRFYLRTSRQLRHLDLESQAPLVASVRDASRGVVYIRSFGWQSHIMERNFHLMDEAQKPVYLLYCAQVSLGLVLDQLSTLLAMLLVLFTLYLKRGTSPNAIGISFLSLILISQCFNGVIVAWTHLETSVGALARIRDFIQKTPAEQDGNTPLPPRWPAAGNVEIHIQAARYESGIDQPQRSAVLKNLSLSVAAGKKVGVMGRTGSGKTSLLLTLLGFLEYNGSIKIDGVEVRDTPHDELRSKIITVTQDNLVLDGTIRENLLPFDTRSGERLCGPLTEKESTEAAQKDTILREVLVYFQIWESIEETGGLDAIVSDIGYSHGQLQMLCIARAVVRRRMTGSRLVLVDEGTSAVDRWRDVIVRQAMAQYFSDCTIIIVAHRDETVADAHLTVTLSKGEIVERR